MDVKSGYNPGAIGAFCMYAPRVYCIVNIEDETLPLSYNTMIANTQSSSKKIVLTSSKHIVPL